ncbi:MAG: carbohydrate porin [Phycisphaerales bacterium]
MPRPLLPVILLAAPGLAGAQPADEPPSIDAEPLAIEDDGGIRFGPLRVSALGAATIQWLPDQDIASGAIVIEPEFDLTLSERDRINVKFGFAGGDAVNDDAPYQLSPWWADLEDDVKDINGSGRNYLLTAWWQHTFDVGPDATLSASAGLIDSTWYVDLNNYANLEYTQFLNQAFVNAPNLLLPAYDLGVALEWASGPWSVAGVVMHVEENDDGESYMHASTQIAYAWDAEPGAGNLRLTLAGASDDFRTADGAGTAGLFGASISFDQELGESLGVWARVGHQDDDAAITYERKLTGGVAINGHAWGRPDDTIGVGYGFLDNGNTGVDSTNVFEIYTRIALDERFGLTFDAQWMRDAYDGASEENGWILGVRLDYAF